jgi:hypothetical protein
MNDDKPNRRLSGSHLRSALDVVATVSIIALSLTLVWTLLSGRAVAGRSDGRSPNAGAPGQRPEPRCPRNRYRWMERALKAVRAREPSSSSTRIFSVPTAVCSHEAR